MTIVTVTRAAKCKDCIFLKAKWKGKQKTHFCNNSTSPYFNLSRTLKDFVCDVWKLF